MKILMFISTLWKGKWPCTEVNEIPRVIWTKVDSDSASFLLILDIHSTERHSYHPWYFTGLVWAMGIWTEQVLLIILNDPLLFEHKEVNHIPFGILPGWYERIRVIWRVLLFKIIIPNNFEHGVFTTIFPH